MRTIRMQSIRLTAGLGFLGAALALGACEGTNAFEVGGQPGPDPGEDVSAPTVEITSPEEGRTFLFGDTLTVVADASDDQGLDRVTFEGFTVQGDPELGEDSVIVVFDSRTVDLDEGVADTTGLRRRLLPQEVSLDSATVSIVATAVDVAGNTSTDTVRIEMGSSSVRILEPEEGAEVFAGANSFRVEAVDPQGVRELLFIVDADEASPDTTRQLFDPATEEASFEGSFPIPSDVAGQAELVAVLRNVTGDVRTSETVTVTFEAETAVDETPPEVRFQAEVRQRAELTDSVRIVLTSRDPTPGDGLARAGVSLWATNTDVDTVRVVSDTVEFTTAPRSSTDTLWVALDRLVEDPEVVPDTIRIRVAAWAEDEAGFCGAAVDPDEFQSLECGLAAGAIAGADRDGLSLGAVTVVSGRTAALPGGGRVADIVWDTVTSREQVVVANLGLNQIQFIDAEAGGFLDGVVLVPAPWGLSFDRDDPDRLFAANSGGTNLSLVDVSSFTHLVSEQILTPNTVLWQVRENATETKIEQVTEFFDFSDRPQFIAADRFNNLVYSTRPTPAAPDGTIRLVNRNLGPDPEVIFYTDYVLPLEPDENVTAIDRADFVSTCVSCGNFGDDEVVVEDHVPGDTTDFVEGRASGPGAAGRAVQEVQDQVNRTGQPRAHSGGWNPGAVGLSDTTFVAASGDGSRIAIGEGNTAPTGRIMLYSPGSEADEVGSITNGIRVEDLVGNASERVFGIDLSYDGFLGGARGELAAYFFDSDLRLQMSVELGTGGAGIALHPLHVGGFLTTQEAVALAFVGSTDNTIRIFDTRRGSQVGQVLLRDLVTGVMKASLPMSFDNQGLTCPSVPIAGTGGQSAVNWMDPSTDDRCVVVKLAAVTQDNGVVVVNVRKGDFF